MQRGVPNMVMYYKESWLIFMVLQENQALFWPKKSLVELWEHSVEDRDFHILDRNQTVRKVPRPWPDPDVQYSETVTKPFLLRPETEQKSKKKYRDQFQDRYWFYPDLCEFHEGLRAQIWNLKDWDLLRIKSYQNIKKFKPHS